MNAWNLALGAVVLTAVLATGRPAVAADTIGVPVTIKKATTQTVDQIMERDRLLPPYLLRRPRPIEQELETNFELQEDPNAPPPMSHWPPIPESFSSAVAPVEPPNLPQTVGVSFKAATYGEGFWYPPDSNGDVGPTQIVIHVNGRIKVFDRTGALGPLNADAAVFWGPVLLSNFPGDPQVRYDRLSGRWFILSTDFGSANNQIMIAVSSGPTITGTGSFTYYAFTIGNVLPADTPFICDYPSLGVDANALYVGCNMFDASFTFYQYSSAYVIRKSSVLSGGPMVVTGFSNMGSAGAGPYAPRGVDNDDPTWTEGYFIGTDPGILNRISIRRVGDPAGTPTLGSNIVLAISSTNLLDQSALGSSTQVNSQTLRLFAASIHKNKITGVTSLWTAHSVETDVTCTPSGGGDSRRLGAKWYEIGNLTSSPSITQFGTLCTTNAGSPQTNSQRGFLYPSVIGSGQGHMALSASYASSTEFVGVAAAGRLRTDPLGGTRTPETLVQTGLASYTILDGINRNRWGDYTLTDVDPNDDQTIWTFQEYADTPANNWAMKVVQLKAPPPPNLVSISNPVCVNVPAAPVTVNGADSCAVPTCTNGLCGSGGPCPEFFDPGPDPGGPGFANHLTVTVTGGITVNSAQIVLPASPATQRVLQVALSLNTTGATTGTKTVSIVNPDGQGKSAAIISVVGNRLPVSRTGGPYTSCQGGAVALDGTTSTDPDAACGDAIVTYEWDLNNDGTFDVTGATPTVTGAQLATLGVGVGANTIKLRTTDTHGATNTGSGTLTILADAAACDDADNCTTGETCNSGACGGGAPNPPGELQNARFTAPTTFVWDTIPNGPTYDVLRGELAALPIGPGGGDETCFNDLLTAVLNDPAPPSPGTGFWYVVRGANACGIGGYGTQHDLTPRTSTTCP